MQKQIEPARLRGDFPPEEFAARRRRLFDLLDGASAVLQGAGPPRGYETFRQTNAFYYLTGVETPQAIALLDGRSRTTTLFLPARADDEALTSEHGAAGAALAGVEALRPLSEAAAALRPLPAIFAPHAPGEGRQVSRDVALRAQSAAAADPWDGAPSREERFLVHLRREAPPAAIRDLDPLLDGLRLFKSPRELELLRKAGRLSALSAVEAMKSGRPGVRAHELAAATAYLYRVNGAMGEGYAPIVPAGAHVFSAHWSRNDDVLQAGDFVLFDCAPDVGYYTSDIGRMWAAGGRFQPWQRELYGFMARYHATLLRLLRPGRYAGGILEEAAAEMSRVIGSTSWSKPSFERAAKEALQYAGHLSHPVGMAVHDVGEYRNRILEPGMVFAVDPQLWVREERLYVRVEDTVAVTADGIEILTGQAPFAVDDVEGLASTGGMVQSFPALKEAP